ncbi:winged helix-turn-helix transcriptional regulator [Nocardiopsis akebiae]|uniref:Winged helix-turn-helix transcriptional regulator n=1 Tax=Nocardiopsis akebiae TaxID=2831968 RepID=A0ABX8C5J3_9ACTN|nr:winged helix-turn-helix transcriptional regulator [Nocardiopsis akebiae]
MHASLRASSYPPGSTLSPENALAGSEGASRSTVRAALQILESEGLVVAKQGRGRVVATSGHR